MNKLLPSLFFATLYAVFNVAGAAVIKWKLKGKVLNEFNDWVQFLLSVHVISAFILIFISALVLFKALSSGNFSFVIPVATGVNFVLTLAVGYFVFKDNLSMLSLIGFVFILSGIILLSFNNH